MRSKSGRAERGKLGFSDEERAAFSHEAQGVYPDNQPATHRRTIVPGQAGPSALRRKRGATRNQVPVAQQAPRSPIEHRRFDISLQGKEQPGFYEQQREQRFHLDARSRKVLYLAAGLVAIFLLVLVLPNNMFSVNNQNLSAAWFASVLGRNLQNLVTLISGGGAFGGIDFTVIRLVIIGLAGAALAVSGTAYQGALRNQLACPSTLGVMSGAQLGCILYVWIFPTATFLGSTTTNGTSISTLSASLFGSSNVMENALAMSQMALFSLAGSLCIVGLVLFVSSLVARHRNPSVAMVIIGQVVTGCISSFVVIARMYFVQYGDSWQMDAVTTIMLGSFDNAFTASYLLMMGVPLCLVLGIVIALRGKLNLLAFDEGEARSMGLKTGALRACLVVCCTLLTAIVVAFCGAIGYVGFLIPHLARRIVGPDFRFLLPASALMGAGFLLLAFWLISNFTVPGGSISMATTAIGVCLFIAVVFHQRRSGLASW